MSLFDEPFEVPPEVAAWAEEAPDPSDLIHGHAWRGLLAFLGRPWGLLYVVLSAVTHVLVLVCLAPECMWSRSLFPTSFATRPRLACLQTRVEPDKYTTA